jgi:hypothetical protein
VPGLRLEVVRLLVGLPGVDLNARGFARTPLPFAAECGDLALVQALIANPDVEVEEYGAGAAALGVALANKHWDVALSLISPVDVNTDDSALALAVNDTAVLRALVELPSFDPRRHDHAGARPSPRSTSSGRRASSGTSRRTAADRLSSRRSRSNRRTSSFSSVSRPRLLAVLERAIVTDSVRVVAVLFERFDIDPNLTIGALSLLTLAVLSGRSTVRDLILAHARFARRPRVPARGDRGPADRAIVPVG